ncbi:SLOG family protein [Chakrabartyella piscis]|uniref:SLOG family protein n=1 Tax=Chakrabartyella piscis TaxID=2918914 RepID=UPI002958A139|nr:SLOG family protein [Chakrabartyella piscis]
MKEKTASVTGHRKLPMDMELEILQKQLANEIEVSINDGYIRFLFGGAIGWDMLCGFVVASLKEKYKEIQLVAVVPFREQEEKWSKEEQTKYRELLHLCDEVIILQEEYTKDCFKNRNQYMVDHSSKVIAYYNGGVRSGTGQTIRMAEKQKLNIVNLY